MGKPVEARVEEDGVCGELRHLRGHLSGGREREIAQGVLEAEAELGVPAHQDSALDRGDVLSLVEAEQPRVSEGADPSTTHLGVECLRRIIHHPETPFGGEGLQVREVVGDAEEIRRDQRQGPSGIHPGKGFPAVVQGVGVHVHRADLEPRPNGRRSHRIAGVPGDQHLIGSSSPIPPGRAAHGRHLPEESGHGGPTRGDEKGILHAVEIDQPGPEGLQLPRRPQGPEEPSPQFIPPNGGSGRGEGSEWHGALAVRVAGGPLAARRCGSPEAEAFARSSWPARTSDCPGSIPGAHPFEPGDSSRRAAPVRHSSGP